jgi:hypothetical protein
MCFLITVSIARTRLRAAEPNRSSLPFFPQPQDRLAIFFTNNRKLAPITEHE